MIMLMEFQLIPVHKHCIGLDIWGCVLLKTFFRQHYCITAKAWFNMTFFYYDHLINVQMLHLINLIDGFGCTFKSIYKGI